MQEDRGRTVGSDGSFEAIPSLAGRQLMLLFRHHLIENLLACGPIGQATLDILDRFHHPGFSAYEGEGEAAGDSAARERLASYFALAQSSLARLRYDRHAGVVSYEPRAPSRSHLSSPAPERFSPLDALAAGEISGPVAAKMLLRALGTTKGAVRTDVAGGALLCADRMMAEDREGALSMLDALSRPDIPDNVRIPAMHLQVTAAAALNRPRTAPSPQ